ncbi:MAG: protein kinase [Candidatus Thiodiazotropha endolucinida]
MANIGEKFLDWIASDKRNVIPPLAVEKVLHRTSTKDDTEKTRKRLEIEINALETVSHPNLVQLMDVNLKDLSYVTEFYPGGTLSGQSQFKGKVLESLVAIRPLIEGVACLHDNGFTHRDIKPENIFIALDGRLVLGDFGIVFFSERDRTRVTDTFEKVGTTDYMPGWIRREYVDQVKPSFDVFALGKVIYEMIAGRRLHLWYLDEHDFNLLNLFPRRSSEMRLARQMLGKCVCESEGDCLPNATAMLEEVDRTIFILQRHGQQVGLDIGRHCGVCADGIYQPVDELSANVGVEPQDSNKLKLFSCSNCGHLQVFLFERGKEPSAWK